MGLHTTGWQRGCKREVKPDRLRIGSVCLGGQFSFACALAHAEGVNSLIRLILAAGRRVNKSLMQANGLTNATGNFP